MTTASNHAHSKALHEDKEHFITYLIRELEARGTPLDGPSIDADASLDTRGLRHPGLARHLAPYEMFPEFMSNPHE